MKVLQKLTSVVALPAWYLPGRPILSLRRLASLIYFKIKRRMGYDYAFSPPGKSNVPIDIYMPTIEKDAAMLELAISHARKYVMHPIGNIYIVAPAKSQKLRELAQQHGCQFVDEATVVGIDKANINYQVGDLNRNGWIYKMLVNLAADTICQSRYILILDADTCFIAPQIFLYHDRPLFNLSNEYHQPYFDATERLTGIKHRLSRSFITHYMLFDAEILRQLRDDLEKKWQKPWYEAIVQAIDKTEKSGFADYEIYGDYYLAKAGTKPYLNYWSNVSVTLDSWSDLARMIGKLRPNFRSISLHNYQLKLED